MRILSPSPHKDSWVSLCLECVSDLGCASAYTKQTLTQDIIEEEKALKQVTKNPKSLIARSNNEEPKSFDY